MIGAIVATIPLGLGIALNPLAIVVSILILRATDSRRNGIAFAIGWVLGLALLVVLSTLIVQDQVVTRHRTPPTFIPWVWTALGGFMLLAAALALWRGRQQGERAGPPRWLRAIDGGQAWHKMAIGLFLATFSLRNLALLAAAASVIGQAGLVKVEMAIVAAAFVAISSAGILIPLFVRLFGGESADAILQQWGDWLTTHMATLTAAVLAVLGLYLLSKGLPGVL
ncbi:MAG: GAP family protein [Thermomicrobiales bacterium]